MCAHYTDRTRLEIAIDCIEEAKTVIRQGDKFSATSYYGYELNYEIIDLFINGHDVNYAQNYTYPKFTVMVLYSLNGYVSSYPLRKFLGNDVGVKGHYRKLTARGSIK